MKSNDPCEPKPGFTVETMGYALSACLALALRLVDLGRWPLLYDEAAVALASWRMARGVAASLQGHSPLLLHANAVLLFFTNGSDAAVRWLPVLCGVALVLLPWGLRRQLGRAGALTASLLLALSPTLTYFSRTLDGSIVVAGSALACVVALTHYAEARQSKYLVAAAALVMLALLAGPGAYSLLLSLMMFPFFLRLAARLTNDRTALDGLLDAGRTALADRKGRRQAVLAACVVFLVASLAWTLNPAGLQLTLDQFQKWATAFELPGTHWNRSLLLLAFYEGLPLLGGLLGLAAGRGRRDLLSWWLRSALLVGAVLTLFSGPQLGASLWLVVIPLVLLTGQWVGGVARGWRESAGEPLFWVPLALTAVVAGAAHVQLVSYMNQPTTNHVLRMAALAVFLLSSLALVGSLSRTQLVVRSGAACLLLVGGLLLVRANVRLNLGHGRDPIEPLVGRTTSTDVRALVATAYEWSHRTTGDPLTMAWQVDQRLEVPLGWYLRDFNVSFVREVSAQAGVQGAITGSEITPLARFSGIRFQLSSDWQGKSVAVPEWLRWWIGYRSSLRGEAVDEVIAWVRTTSP